MIGWVHALDQKLSARLINQNHADWLQSYQRSISTAECDNHLKFYESVHPAVLLDPHQRLTSTHAKEGFGLLFKHPHVRRTLSLGHCQQN